MAKINLSNLTEGSLFKQSIQEGEALIKIIKEIRAGLKKSAEISKKNLSGQKGFESASEIGKVEKEIRKVNAVTEMNIKLKKEQERANAKLISQRSQTGEQLAQTRARISELNRVQKQQAIINGQITGAFKRQTTLLASLREQYKNLAVQNKQNTAEGKRLFRQIQVLDKKLTEVNDSVSVGRRRFAAFGKGLSRVSAGFTRLAQAAGLTVGIFGAFRVIKGAIDITRDFEKENAVLAGVLNTTSENITQLTDDAIRLGGVSARTASEVTQLQIALSRLGFKEQDIIELTEPLINGSIALNAELEGTAQLVGAIVNTFDDLDTSDAGAIIDQLTASTQNSALEFEKLNTAIPIVAGAANAAGVPFTKLVALLGKLSDSGIDASSSATALRNIFIESAKQGLGFEQILDKIKNSQDKLTASNDEFGKRAAVSASVLAQNIDAVNDLDLALQTAGGTAERVAREQLDTLDGAIILLTSAWEGFILSMDKGDGILSRVLRGSVERLSRLLNSFSSEAEEATKSTSELFEENTKLIKSSRSLVNEYNDLSEKEEQTSDDTKRLRQITDELSESFGTSAIRINSETGALELNTQEVLKQIQIRAALQSQQAQQLIADKLRAETQIEQGKLARETLKLLQESSVLGEQFIPAAALRSLTKTGAEAAEVLRTLTENTQSFTARQQVLIKRVLELVTNVRQEAIAKEELERINKALLDSGIDLGVLVGTQTQGAVEQTEAITDLIKIQLERLKVAKLSNAVTEEQVEVRNILIKSINKEINRLRALGVEQDKVAKRRRDAIKKLAEGELEAINEANKRRDDALLNDEQLEEQRFKEEVKRLGIQGKEREKLTDDELRALEQLEREHFDRLADIKNAEQDRLDQIEEDARNKREEAERKANEERAERQRKQFQDAVDVITELSRKASQERLKIIDDELAAREKRQDQLLRLAEKGSEDATDNLAFEQRREAQLRAEKQKEIERQKRVELGLTALNTFNAKVQAGDKNPLGSTIRDITLLTAFVRSIPAFYEGTEDTGKGGGADDKGGFLSVLHPRERVMDAKNNAKTGYMDNDKLAEIAEKYRSGEFTEAASWDNPRTSLVHRFESNDSILKSIDKRLADLPGNIDMPQSDYVFGEFERAMIFSEKKRKRLKRNHYKLGRLFG